MSSLRKIQALSWDECWLLVQASLFLPLTALAVHTVGVGRWQRALARLSLPKKATTSNHHVATIKATDKHAVPGDEHATIQRARGIARMVRIAASRGIYRANCLQQSLVLWWLLAINGIESELRFGARKGNTRLEAHAWVACCGVPLNEAADLHEQFSRFETPASVARAE